MLLNEPSLREKLMEAGLRPTRQRMLIGEWLFDGIDRHFTAEDLHREMVRKDNSVSLATIYNTLGAFTHARLLDTVTVETGRVFYDTNMLPHYHLYDEDNQVLTDIAQSELSLGTLPPIPEGQSLRRIDVIIRTRCED